MSMSYWVLILLAASAGTLFGSASPSWPWRRPHPVRNTLAFVLPVAASGVLVGAHLLDWDEGRVATGSMFAAVGLAVVVAVWLDPDQSVRMRLAYILGYGLLVYYLYGRYFAGP